MTISATVTAFEITYPSIGLFGCFQNRSVACNGGGGKFCWELETSYPALGALTDAQEICYWPQFQPRKWKRTGTGLLPWLKEGKICSSHPVGERRDTALPTESLCWWRLWEKKGSYTLSPGTAASALAGQPPDRNFTFLASLLSTDIPSSRIGT